MADYKENISLFSKIAILCIFLPSLIHDVVFGWKSRPVVDGIKKNYENLGSNAPYTDLIGGSFDYLGQFIGAYFAVALVFIVGYFASIHVAFKAQSGQGVSLSQALKQGLKLSMPKGVFIFGFIFLLGMLSNTLFPPMILIFVLSLMIPIVATIENKSYFASLKYSMFLKYAIHAEHFGPWRAFFTLSGIIGFYYLALLLLGYLFGNNGALGLFLPYAWWNEPFMMFPFSMIYMVKLIFTTLIYSLIIGSLPVICTRFYLEVRNRISQKV